MKPPLLSITLFVVLLCPVALGTAAASGAVIRNDSMWLDPETGFLHIFGMDAHRRA
jgi:hypothetical protein